MDKLTDDKKTFILLFTKYLWIRIYVTAIIYVKHKQLETYNRKELFMKSLKYNFLSPTGSLSFMHFLIQRALNQGFLMPQYTKNTWIEDIIMEYKQAYQIISKNKNVINYIKDFQWNGKVEEQILKELNVCSLVKSTDNKILIHELCELIDSWDISCEMMNLLDDISYDMLNMCLEVLKNS